MKAAVSETGYGVDVSLRRPDDLEKRLQKEVQAQPGCQVLDLGCGAGGAAARLEAAGARVVGVDVHDFSQSWEKLAGEFIRGDARELGALVGDTRFDFCLCSRLIHYVPYDAAVQILQDLHGRVTQRLFISFSGINADLARGYGACQEPIHTRFEPLPPADQRTFGISVPLTLYSEAEAITLLQSTGWYCMWVRTSDFGNIKAIVSPTS